jgi:hypothetical protein
MDFEKLIPCLFPFVFIFMWVGLMVLFSHLGGWARLAQHYQARSPFVGKKWHMRTGHMGWVGYGNCLTIGSNYYGLYLAILPFLRVGHPALFIPWDEISTSKSKWFWLSYLNFTFARTPSVTFGVPERLGNMILAGRSDVF